MSYKVLQYSFILLVLLMLFVYATGARTSIGAISTAVQQFIFALTGRNAQGVFTGPVGVNTVAFR